MTILQSLGRRPLFLMKNKIYLLVENQAEINYAMVIRNMLYDAIDYATQVNVMGKKNRATKEPKKSAEFLSGISKDDKIITVITIVLYWDDKKWNGARKPLLRCLKKEKTDLPMSKEIQQS